MYLCTCRPHIYIWFINIYTIENIWYNRFMILLEFLMICLFFKLVLNFGGVYGLVIYDFCVFKKTILVWKFDILKSFLLPIVSEQSTNSWSLHKSTLYAFFTCGLIFTVGKILSCSGWRSRLSVELLANGKMILNCLRFRHFLRLMLT